MMELQAMDPELMIHTQASQVTAGKTIDKEKEKRLWQTK
jgi:hypothetical protein